MSDWNRRGILRHLGLASTLGLAGCQYGSSEETPTETTVRSVDPGGTSERPASERPGTTSTPSPTVRLGTEVDSGPNSKLISVVGRIEVPWGIDTIEVRTGDRSVTVDAAGATEYELDATLRVEGGRKYQIDVIIFDEDGNRVGETIETEHVPIFIDPIETDRLVGAHYYPWYEMHSGHENWTDRTVSTPVLGEYASDAPSVVDQHLKWSLEHGIRWWSVSWWGPETPTDRALRDTIAQMEQFDDVRFSILYETVGRMEEFDYDMDESTARSRLAADLRYLERTYFERDNYLHMDGRPVVFFYVSSSFHGDVEGAFEEAMATLDADLYVLADTPFGSPPSNHPINRVADAVTSYNPYVARPDVEDVFHERYARGNKIMHLGAEAADLGFVPVVIPGYNDTGLPATIREDNPVLSASPDRYERVCEQVAPHLADGRAVLVTSFNEWYENTQIEPSEQYDTAYLEATANKLATGTSPGFDPDGKRLRFVFNETIVPAEVNPDSSDNRELAFMAGGLTFRDGGETHVSFDIGDESNEPLFLRGAYGAEGTEDKSWRWFGGRSAETVVFVEYDLAGADTAVLTGQPMRSNEISAEVFFEDVRTDHVEFEERDGEFDDYVLSLTPS